MNIDYASIMTEVKSKVAARLPHILAQHTNPYPCGMSWITFKDLRSPFVKYLRRNQIGRPGSYGGWTIGSSEFMTGGTQNMFVREAVCDVAKEVFSDHGINCTIHTRID